MTKRDCFFSIAIIMLIEYFIFDWTYRFSADKNLTDHISFAGTIIGIILAVVAIFYSFIQSESQTRSSTEIASEIGSLRVVVKEIDLSKIRFSDELDRMSDIAKKLDVLDSHLGESNIVLSSVQSDVIRITSQMESLKRLEAQPMPTGVTVNDGTEDDKVIRKILNASYDTLIFSHCLKLSIGKQYAENDLLFEHFALPLAEIAKATAEPDKGMDEWKATFARRASSAIQIMRILNSMGYLEVTDIDEKVTLGAKLEDVLKSIDFTNYLSGDRFRSIRDAISASFAN